MSIVKAISVLRGDAGVSGVVTFEQKANGGPTSVTGTIKGLKPGMLSYTRIHMYYMIIYTD